ncbi:hypothetical protein [Streptomyces chiangmaiensis]|uniref:Uncharacterized protein n=1 Tax=Streptomyces chiangmaiensis TaxID=766497 RepID=A0ABU7FAY4_9ACTN|nr:hypothetical protein [Streptomyces chiangmaiensis]MED7820973.1 hypothetical protein [Streptomyces chiangmaiensis]
MNGPWLLRGRDGSLSTYATRDEAVWCRAERQPSLHWTSARRVGGEQRVRAQLAVGQGPDGYAHLVAWRPTVRGEFGLVHSTHFRPHLSALDWVPIGHPNKKGDRTGLPAVAVDAEGRAHVFVRNQGGGVSMLAQKERGGWGPWHDLGGLGAHEELAAVTGHSGRIELYATTDDGLLRWSQEKPGEALVPDDALEARVRPGTLTALHNSKADGTALFFTDPEGMLHTWRPGGVPRPLLAAAGPGPVAALGCVVDGRACTLLAQRSASGRVVICVCPTEQGSVGLRWTESGPQLPAGSRVAVAEDAQGRVVAASLTEDGELRLARQKDGTGPALDTWQTV